MLFDSFSVEYTIYRWHVCAGRALPTPLTNVTKRAGLIDEPIRSMLNEYTLRILIPFGLFCIYPRPQQRSIDYLISCLLHTSETT